MEIYTNFIKTYFESIYFHLMFLEQPRQPVKLLWLIPTLAVGIIFAIVAIIVMIGIIVFYSR